MKPSARHSDFFKLSNRGKESYWKAGAADKLGENVVKSPSHWILEASEGMEDSR